MATLDEIFAAMPDEAAGGTHELLVIDADTREIYVPDSEMLFGVEHDGNAETKYFQCPRYVGKGIDLAACFLRVNFQNANGERDGYLVKDTTSDDENIYFSWELWPKVTQYKGTVQFVLCASLPGSTKTADWHTTLAQGNVLEGLEPDAEVVAAASSDLIAQLLATVAAQEANVEAVGAEQVQTVQAAAKAAQEAAVAEIEAKKQNTLAEIPDDYTAMAAQVDTLARTTAGAIVCQAEGMAIQVANASNHPLAGLRIFGRSTQDGTPTPDNPVEIVSTPAPTVTVCGKNLADFHCGAGPDNYVSIVDVADLRAIKKGNRYTLSVDIHAAAATRAYWNNATKIYGYLEFDVQPGTNRYTYTFTATADGSLYDTRTNVVNKYPANDGVLVTASNAQIEAGDNATEYEPFTGGTVTLANGLPGIPVASGGNYTDADGQQWICDEVDLARGVYVQRVELKTFILSKSAYQDTPLGYRYQHHAGRNFTPGNTCLCKTLPYNDKVGTTDETTDGVRINKEAGYIIAQYTDTLGTAETINLDILYILATPTETPLSEAEPAAFAALHSVKPATTILNDSGAHMAVEYVADTKLYIDSKLAELVAAMNA